MEELRVSSEPYGYENGWTFPVAMEAFNAAALAYPPLAKYGLDRRGCFQESVLPCSFSNASLDKSGHPTDFINRPS